MQMAQGPEALEPEPVFRPCGVVDQQKKRCLYYDTARHHYRGTVFPRQETRGAPEKMLQVPANRTHGEQMCGNTRGLPLMCRRPHRRSMQSATSQLSMHQLHQGQEISQPCSMGL